MKTLSNFLSATILGLSLAACGGIAGTGTVPASAPNAGASVPLARNSVLITALFGTRPIANLLVTLSRDKKGGPVIGKGRTGGMGRVRLNGTWTPKDFICAWAVYDHEHGHYETERCQNHFPSTLTLQFKRD